jgi:hypothetical protein
MPGHYPETLPAVHHHHWRPRPNNGASFIGIPLVGQRPQ